MEQLNALLKRAKHFSVSDIASHSGLSQPYISALLAKKRNNPTITALTKLSKAIDKLERNAVAAQKTTRKRA